MKGGNEVKMRSDVDWCTGGGGDDLRLSESLTQM
jgi:hypothetical protein